MSTISENGSEETSSQPEPGWQNLPGADPGRRPIARQVAIGAIVLVFMVAGVAVPLALIGHSLGTDPTIDPKSGPGSGASGMPAAPATAVVACTDEGTELLTPVVRPQPDGVHFRTDNRTDRTLTFDIETPGGGGFGTGAPIGYHPVDADAGFNIAPGTIQVRCADPEDPSWPATPSVTLTVDDPEGLWVPGFQMMDGCDRMSIGSLDYVQGAVGEQGNPVDLAWHDLASRIEPGDEVRSAGYPEAIQPSVAVIRDDRVVAVAYYFPDSQGGWLLGQVRACAD
jgi:hypothetical protein